MWIEICWEDAVTEWEICSSPCGDVNWNSGYYTLNGAVAVRLLAETWVVILKVRLKNTWKKVFVPSRRCELKSCILLLWDPFQAFVSLRGCELKLLTDNTDRSIKCSSPYGDVSWNLQHFTYSYFHECSSPLRGCELKFIADYYRRRYASSSPCGDVNWNSGYYTLNGAVAVRLLAETWFEIFFLVRIP